MINEGTIPAQKSQTLKTFPAWVRFQAGLNLEFESTVARFGYS